jgi:FtsP/CotA-like multicopper oxidase with cupredoxin domain
MKGYYASTKSKQTKKMLIAFLGLWIAAFSIPAALQAFSLTVTGSDGGNVGSYRWLLEEDVTFHIDPQAQTPGQQTLEFHKSYMPVVAKGTSADLSPLTNADATKHYYLSILPDNAGTDAGYTIGGAPVKPNQAAVAVTVNKLPLPTAQITVFAFEDNYPINNSPNLPQEKGLAGFKVILKDAGGRYGISGGQQMLDAFGNPVGTVGTATTDADGYATFKNLSPGKYAVEVIPPAGQGWLQTTTIEGTKGIDAWVKANEPALLVEFGVPTTHIFVGFVKQHIDAAAFTGSFSITGQVVNFHMARPPDIAGTAPANSFKNVYIGLNDPAGKGIYAQPADPDTGEFTIDNIPPGSYLVTVWDKYLDLIISFQIVNVSNENVDLGQLAVPAWFGRLDSWVFYDGNGNGVRDPGEMGMPEQAVNLRFRDGSMYQSFPTDLEGYVPFDEVFPFFNWLIAEVDFARFKATGATIVVDAGGAVTNPTKFDGLLQPQPQPENGGAEFRAETGEVLLQGIQTFQGQTNRIEWGKKIYGLNESGGISGIVFYSITRAENDPRFGTGDPWEPGIPRVQVNLYPDGDVDRAPQGNFPGPEDSDWDGDGILDQPDGVIDDANRDGVPGQLADVDNYPFGWSEGGVKGTEDLDHNGNGIFDLGDAIAIATTDSWDDNLPTGCPGNTSQLPEDVALGDKCYDGLRNWNQVRPAVFDGGYAFPGYTVEKGEGILPGTYIVQAVPPPGYEIVKEEDKNVDFGDTYTPSTQLLPAVCVGDSHEVPQFLSLFPDQQIEVVGWTPGMTQPLCDRKQVILSQGQNAATDFHMFTEVPIAAHFTGLINNDLGNEFNPNNPTFAEKASAAWIPVALRDHLGREITRVYGDQYGTYNGVIHSTYTKNIPNPSGVSPAMYSVCINDPGPYTDPLTGQTVAEDPNYRREFTTSCYTFMFMPGTTTYLDTPLLPLTAFAGQTTFPLDAQFPGGTPVIAAVNGTGPGPFVSGTGQQITITSLGNTSVPNPDYNPNQVGSQSTITRDYGFGATQGNGSVAVGGTSLTIDSWNNGTIVATVQAGVNTGQLVVTRDNGHSTIVGITLTVGPYAGGTVRTVGAGGIQAAIDAAASGDLILVPTGEYNELVILYKNVRLQGSGANTIINAVKNPPEKITNWRTKVETLVNSGQASLLPGQDPSFSAFPNTGLFPTELGPGILVMPAASGPNAFTAGVPRIDGFTIRSADSGGGILVNGYGNNLQISNNRIRSNHGTYSAGIRIGHPVTPFAFGNQQVDANNDNIVIRYNDISQNGSTGGGFEGATGGAGGGISIYNGTDNYQIRDNYIVGNFTTMSGAGIGHFGLSDNGLIDHNTIAFNQSFHQTVNSASGGGISIEGILPAGGGLSFGSGSVTITDNKIQGNLAGSGDGGGIRLLAVNGLDVAGPPANWDQIVIDNNFIVNNIAGLAGGGISLQGAARVSITNNTIAHNDSTATAGPAFTTGTAGVSAPQPAGIVSRAHDPALLDAIGTGVGREFSAFPNPVLTLNIIWQNRSFHFDINQNFPIGAIQPDPSSPGYVPRYWDLGLLGAVGQLDPENGILTTLTGPDGAVYDGLPLPTANTTQDPQFAIGYFNGNEGSVVVEDRQTPLQAAAALDEGGNFIDIRFSPLTLDGNYDSPAAVGANGSIGVLTTSDGSGGGSGGGWGCFISTASEEGSPGSGKLAFAALGLAIIFTIVRLSRRFKGCSSSGMQAFIFLLAAGLTSGLAVPEAGATVLIQCPGDLNSDAVPDPFILDANGIPTATPNPEYDPNVVCKHVAAGDGFINMADNSRRLQYMFGFSDVTGVNVEEVMMQGMLAANFPAPTIKVKEGQKLYLTLTNVGMVHRPDLFDPHSVHYHGFPNAAAVFDGVPEASIVINMGSSLTYFYLNAEPGTFLYHCHVEATEHMQMGMLGQLYVTPKQDGTVYPDPDGTPRSYNKFAYNDGDGSTGYDVDYPIQIASFDPDFHDASFSVQPLPFALMKDRFPMLNGRGYPDTVNSLELTNTADVEGYPSLPSQKLNSLITAKKGQKILLRISSLSTTSFHTISALGIPMKVVGRGARILRGPGGKNLYYNTNSVDLGGGEAVDVILDTWNVAPGTYFLYAKNLDHLSNDAEDFGGMMTEILVNP